MTDQISFPPLHDPAPGELTRRRQHLLSEITRPRERGLPSLTVPRGRLAVLAGVAIALAAGATALSAALGGGSVAQAAPILIRTPSGKTVSLAPSSPTASTTEIVGGSDTEQTLMREVIAGMQPTAIERIAMVDKDKYVALHFRFTAASAQAVWEESLVAAAFRDRARAAGDDVSIRTYDGISYGASPPPGLHTLPPAEPGDADAARRFFADAAARAGVSFSSLSVYEPDGVAVAATFASDDPASFLLHQMPAFLAALGDGQPGLDGMYIGLVDGNGNTVWEAFWTHRSSQGGTGSIPALAGCSPVTHGGGFQTPPCPAS